MAAFESAGEGHAPGDGARHETEKAEFGGLGQPCVLHAEAARLFVPPNRHSICQRFLQTWSAFFELRPAAAISRPPAERAVKLLTGS